MSSVAASADIIRRLSEKHKEPTWLLEQRQKAYEIFEATPMPDRVPHLWRYSDPTQFLLPGGPAAALEGTNDAEGAAPIATDLKKDATAAWAVVHQDKLVESGADAETTKAGVIVTDMHTAVRDHVARVQPLLYTAVPATHGKFEALNAALWQGGAFVYIPNNVVLAKPIHIVLSAPNGAPLVAPRVLISAGTSSQATIVVEYASANGAKFLANAAIELFAGQNSNIRYVTIQNWSEKAISFSTQRNIVQRDAQLLGLWAGLGAKVSKADLGSSLVGPGSSAKLWGLAFAQGRQHFDTHTKHRHAADNTYSNLDFKVVLKDKARSAYTGLIRIEKDSKTCEAYQENRNLLISEGPRVDTIPELEILNDDVKCTHGATIGPVNEEEIYYCQARGISREEAMRLVVAGFLEPTIKDLPEDLGERLRGYIQERLKEI